MENIEIRSMTRGQIKALRKKGFDLALLEKADGNKALEAMEWIFDTVYPEYAGDDELPYSEVIRIAKETYRKTYGVDDSVKN